MATGQESPNSSRGVKQLKDDPEEDVREVTDSDCAVCLQPSVHPVKLPCGHIFCFLCVKGIALLSRKCAMCRQEIPLDCLEHPELLKAEDLLKAAQPGGGRYEWYYEGRNGWWQYDERTSGELESAFQRNEEEVEVLVAGFIYAIDLANMTQRRKNGMGRVRAIKRDIAAIPDKKGVAGLRLPGAGGNFGARAPVPPSHGAFCACGFHQVHPGLNRPRPADAALDDDSQPVPIADQPPPLSSGGTDEEPDLSAGSVAGASRESPRLPPRGDVDNDLDAHFGQLRLASTGSPPPPRNRRRGDNGDGVEGSGQN